MRAFTAGVEIPRICAVPMSECSCKWWSSTTLRTRGRSRKMAVFRVSLVHEGGKSLLHPSVILNLTALRVPRAEMLWCGCPHRALPNVTPVRSTIPLTLELFSTFAHRSAPLRANPVKNVGNDVFSCWQHCVRHLQSPRLDSTFVIRHPLGSSQTEFFDGAPFAETGLPTETVRDRCPTGLPHMIPASWARARASRAFTVPWGTPKKCAASFVVKPLISRN